MEEELVRVEFRVAVWVHVDVEVAKQLDLLFRRLLDGPVEHVVGHFPPVVV